MISTDIAVLDPKERELLDESFHSERLARRIRGVLFSAGIVLVAVVTFGEYGLTTPWFAAIAVAILLVSAVEKCVYHQTMANYESLIRKLVHRIERLEGVPLTPSDGQPSHARPSVVRVRVS